MRIRRSLMVWGLCGLGLLAPAVARAANCTDGQPFKGIASFGDTTFKLKVVCKGAWSVSDSFALGGENFTVELSATEDNTGKECHTQMSTPTGGTDEFEVQQQTCKFTNDQQVKFSVRKQ